MKRVLILAIAVIGVALFGLSKSAKAEIIIQQSFTGNETDCWTGRYSPQVDDNCNGAVTGWDTGPATLTAFQETRVVPTVANPTMQISAVSFHQQGCSQDAIAITMTGYILNSSQLATFKTAGGDVVWSDPGTYSAASGSLTSSCTAGEKKFTFASPYLVNDGDDFAAFAVRMEWATGSGIDQPRFWVEPNSYPTGSFGFDTWSGYYSAGGMGTMSRPITSLGSAYDFAITIYEDENFLTFTYPQNNSTVNDSPLTLTGTCDDDLDLVIYNGITVASSTQSFGSSRVCNSEEWFATVTLDQGYWNAFASSTGATAGIVFYYLAQSTTQDDQQAALEELSDNIGNIQGCPIPFLGWDPCTAVSNFISTLKNNIRNIFIVAWNYLKTTRPYSYVPEVYTAFSDANTTPSSTVPLASFQVATTTDELTYDFQWDINIAGMIDDIIPDSVWDTLRPVFVGILWLAFIVYIYRRFITSA